jgi:hypothetical protein
MSLEDGRVSLPVNATRANLILGMDKRGFFLAINILVFSVMVPHDIRANIAGIAVSVIVAAAFKALGNHAPYALDEIQRFIVLPRWGTASASVHARPRFTPYPLDKGRGE